MKIAWFTPFSTKSSIGRCSLGVTAALEKRASVDIFCFDTGPTHPTQVNVKRFQSDADITTNTLAPYDIVFYNFGNNLPFHYNIFKTSRRFPGVAVLHDFVMHHFFAAYYLDLFRSRPDYLNALERLYGSKMRDKAASAIKRTGPPYFWDTDAVTDCPMFEEVLPRAEGVITHSAFFKNKVARVFGGPVCEIPLHHNVDLYSPFQSRAQLGVAAGSLLILTVGHANPNKRITSTIDALGRLRDRIGPFEFVIAGPCSPDYRREIDSAVRRHGLENNVKVLGEIIQSYTPMVSFSPEAVAEKGNAAA